MPGLGTPFYKDVDVESLLAFDSTISSPTPPNGNLVWSIYHGVEQEVIAIVTQLHGQRLACPCTRELFKNCQELFPSRCTMFSIAQIYTGMMKTSPGSTLYGAAGKAIWEFLDWDIKYSNNSDIRNAALIANKLQSKVSVRTDGTVIEYGWRYDLPEKSGTLVDFREVNDSWLIQILYEDFPLQGLD